MPENGLYIDLKHTKKRLRNIFIVLSAAVALIVALITQALNWLSLRFEWLGMDISVVPTWIMPGIAILCVSIISGIVMSYFTSRIVLYPTNKVLDGMNKLAGGDFDVHIDVSGPREIMQVYDTFNVLARELKSIEILRSDFINNFSHEFKTPIMSINGLIGLMKNNDFPKDKQRQYLEVIEEEMSRLSFMTTNILNLSKLENQWALTDKKKFNISEQLRMCVLLLENLWRDKKLALELDFDEYEVIGNDDMLKQVWINLLDNAIKFSPVGGRLKVDIVKTDDSVTVKIGNTGPEIAEHDAEKIFNKFYRTGDAHTVSGNGIGLYLVKHITELHGGKAGLERCDDMNIFFVELPTA